MCRFAIDWFVDIPSTGPNHQVADEVMAVQKLS
jgi:hypothetical protein